MNRFVTGLAAVSVTALLAACSQLGPGIPDNPATGSPSPTTATSAAPVPSASVDSTVAPAGPVASPAAAALKADLGVQIFWHNVNDPAQVTANANKLLDYVVGLGSNSVGISFPIFTDGYYPTRVYTKADDTPSPASLQVVIGLAKARGLRVLVRPIIDETNIKVTHGGWRGAIKPKNVNGWFASYTTTLLPYLKAAQAANADGFVIGAELDSLLGKTTQWHTVVAAADGVFHGQLSYADNWGVWARNKPTVAGATVGLDAYPPLKLPDSATVVQLTAAWKAWLQRRPTGLTTTVIQEVGLAALPGAYQDPTIWGTKVQQPVVRIQSNWFAGACNAAKSLNMAGLFFWNIDAWADPAKASGYDVGSFMGRSDSTIKACFAAGWH